MERKPGPLYWIFFCIVIGLIVWCGYMGLSASSRASNTEAIAHEAFGLINEHRIEAQIPALVWDNELARKAIAHSQDMNDTNNLKHSGYGFCENVLKGVDVFPSGNTIINEWMSSPLHYSNLMDTRLNYGAIGIADNYATFMAR